MKNKVAVITRTKNRGILLRRALLSVAKQTMQDYVHVIVNDGGSVLDVDFAIGALNESERLKVKIISYPDSKGMEAASNIGIHQSESEFIVIHDDDDSWQPEFLQVTVDFFENNPYAHGVATQCHQIREKISSKKVKIINSCIYKKLVTHVSLFSMCSENIFPPIAFLYKRKVFTEIGFYNESLPVLGDWDFNLRFLQNYDIEYIRIPLANYHHRDKSCNNLGNSIFNDSYKHESYRNKINNSTLRKEITEHKLHLGLLINLSQRLDRQITLRKIKESIEYRLFSNPLTTLFRLYFPDKQAKIVQKRFH